MNKVSRNTEGVLFVLSAASGAGKSTLKDRVMHRFPNLKYSVSATTRPPRQNEKEGVHYFFKSRDEFDKMIAQKELVEYMEVHGNMYGTPMAPIENALKAGFSVILDLDVYGKKNFDKTYPDSVGILIEPPSFEELEKRLRWRKTEDEATIQLRLKNAKEELDFAHRLGKYEYRVVNDDVDVAVEDLARIIEKEISSRGVKKDKG